VPLTSSGNALPALRPPKSKERPAGARLKSQKAAAYLATPQGQNAAVRARLALGHAMGVHDIAPLASLRLKAGLSQADLAQRTGIRQPHLSRLENGHHATVSADTLTRLAQALGVSLDEVNDALQRTVPRRSCHD
jgi:DNA-binding Xre family transcriptional regulator